MVDNLQKARHLRDFLNQELARLGDWDWDADPVLNLPASGPSPKAWVMGERVASAPDILRFRKRRMNFRFSFTEMPTPAWFIECDGIIIDAGLMMDDPNPEHSMERLIGTTVDQNTLDSR
jgi:hypothetical protein